MPEAPMRIEVSYTTSAWFDSKFWFHKVGNYLLEQKKLHSVIGDNVDNYAPELECPVAARGRSCARRR